MRCDGRLMVGAGAKTMGKVGGGEGGDYNDGGLGIDGEVGGAALETLKKWVSWCMRLRTAAGRQGGSEGLKKRV